VSVKPNPAFGHGKERQQSRTKARNVYHLRQLEKVGPAREFVPL